MNDPYLEEMPGLRSPDLTSSAPILMIVFNNGIGGLKRLYRRGGLADWPDRPIGGLIGGSWVPEGRAPYLGFRQAVGELTDRGTNDLQYLIEAGETGQDCRRLL